jgi:alpha-aminoadipic semialdehyde synthase
MVDKAGNRIIAFSKFAGMAGINDTLHLLGLRLAAKGIARNPFLELRQTYQYENGVPEMKEHMRRIGQKIKRFGMPKGTGPLVVAFVGYGRVIGGALEVFSAMGAEEISAEVLRAGADKLDSKKIYYVVLKEGDTVIPKPSSSVCSQPFDVTYYRQHPDEYDPNMEGIMRNATVVINGIKWEAEQPHLVSSALLGQLMEEGIEVVIGDVSCDIGGGFESTVIGTTIEDPYYVFDPRDGSHVMGWKGPGFAVNAVDASPGELPAESSRYFSEILARLIPGIMRVDLRGDFDESVFDPCVASAVEVWNGQLTPRFADRPGLVDGFRRLSTKQGFFYQLADNVDNCDVRLLDAWRIFAGNGNRKISHLV